MSITFSSNIASVDQWYKERPPMGGERHWKDGRSAKELAKAWFPGPGQAQVPSALDNLLNAHPKTSGVQWAKAEPERQTEFDEFSGPRNTDLMLWGKGSSGKTVCGIEAKADEKFDGTAAEKVNQGGNKPERFRLMCEGLWGEEGLPEDLNLRWQLLAGACGVMVEATNYEAKVAVFVVHEFVGLTDPEKVAQNGQDLNRFLQRLSGGSDVSIEPGQMKGPYRVPGNRFFDGNCPLFIGKCREEVNTATGK